MVEKHDHCRVKILEGEYKNRIGIYEDDNLNEDGNWQAIVWLGRIFIGKWITVPYKNLEKIDYS